MRATCYIQLVPKLSRSGTLLGVTAKTISQTMPRVMRDGAHVVKLELSFPDSAFKPITVTADVPMEKLASPVAAEVK